MNEKRQPWMKFYPADWRADPKLRMCSLAARGLWMDMLALMHEAEPYGHLLVNGRAPDGKQLAALVGGRPGEVQFCMNELESAGVFSRTQEGVIYSRRMVRDKDRADEGRRWIAKRWPKTNKGTNEQPNSGDDSPPNRSPTKEPFTQKPEARSQKPESERGERVPRGSRLPPDWALPEDWKIAAEENRTKHGLPSIDLAFEAEKFRNHWHSQAGARGVKLDWRATWMNWALRSEAPRGPPPSVPLSGEQILANAKW